MLPESPAAPSQLPCNGDSTPASLLSHRTAGGLLIDSACVYPCTTVDLCESGDVPVGVCPSSSLLHPRSQAKLDSSICVQHPQPPAGPWASPPPAHAGPWPLTQTHSIINPHSALVHLTHHVPSSRPGTRLLRQNLKKKKKTLVLNLSCPGSVPCLVLNNLQHLWLKPPAKPLLPSKCAEKPAGLVPFPQGPDKGLSVNCM